LVADFIHPDAPDVDWKERKQLMSAPHSIGVLSMLLRKAFEDCII